MIHLVGLPSVATHWEMSLPSNRTTASDGALPTWSSRLGMPGVTTAGRGRSRSWSSQLGSGWARQRVGAPRDKKSGRLFGSIIGLVGLVRLDTLFLRGCVYSGHLFGHVGFEFFVFFAVGREFVEHIVGIFVFLVLFGVVVGEFGGLPLLIIAMGGIGQRRI